MTITSAGYDGTVTETQWATLARYLGRSYAVGADGDWRVEAVSGATRTVVVRAGDGYGHGVSDVADADVQIVLDPVASGTRWDTIVARRDWQPPGGATTFVAVQGTSTQAIAGGLNATPGIIDDQVLALVQVSSASAEPTAVVDLRDVLTRPLRVVNTVSDIATADRYIGLEVYERTGGRRRFWDGSAWKNYALSGHRHGVASSKRTTPLTIYGNSSSSPWTSATSVAVDADTGLYKISASWPGWGIVTFPAGVSARLVRDDTEIAEWSSGNLEKSAVATFNPLLGAGNLIVVDNPGSGPHTYQLQFQVTCNTSGSSAMVLQCVATQPTSLMVEEF